MDRVSLERTRERWEKALNELREPDDNWDEITEVTHPNITVNVTNKRDDSDPPLPAKWIKPFKIGLGIAGFIIGIIAAIWGIVHK